MVDGSNDEDTRKKIQWVVSIADWGRTCVYLYVVEAKAVQNTMEIWWTW